MIGKKTLLEIRERAEKLIKLRIVLDVKEDYDENRKAFIRMHAEGWDIPYSFDGQYFIRTAASNE